MRPRYSSKMAFWSTEVDELRDQTRVETIYLVTGLLLPVWGKLPGDHVQVWRLTTEDGQSLLGRLVPAPLVPKIATAFGVDAAITITPAEAVPHVLAAGESTPLGAYRLQRNPGAGPQRPAQLDWPSTPLPPPKAAG